MESNNIFDNVFLTEWAQPVTADSWTVQWQRLHPRWH